MRTGSRNDIKVASYNVNGVLNPVKRSKIMSKMKKEGVGVIMLQETHLTEIEHVKLKRSGYNQIFSASYKKGHRRGVAIIVSTKLTFDKIKELSDREGRFVMVKGKLEGEMVTFLSVYAPPGSDWGFYRHIFDLITLEAEEVLIMGGGPEPKTEPTARFLRRRHTEEWAW